MLENEEGFYNKDGRYIKYADLSPEVVELIKRPPRTPCPYCFKEHLDYACNLQIEFIKNQIDDFKNNEI